jgi:ribose transport system substrate-binding protein
MCAPTRRAAIEETGGEMRKYVLAAALAAAAMAGAGCGGSGDSSAGAPAKPAGDDAMAKVVADAKATLAKDAEGSDRPLPTEPVKAQRNKSIWAVACTSGGPGCQLPMEALRDAGKTLDWKVTIADGKGTPEGESAAIDAGIASKPDAIVLMAVDCPAVKAALERADAAKVPVYGVDSVDCDDPDAGGGKKLMDATFDYGPYRDPVTFYTHLWQTTANYLIATTDGKGKVLHLATQEPLLAKKSNKIFADAMAKCTTCTVYDAPFTLDDLLTNKVEAKVTAALTAHPDVDAVVAPYGAAVLLGVGNAVQAARRTSGKDIKLAAVDGLKDNLDLIKSGVQTMDSGSQPVRWWGWITMDGLLRLFAGQPQVDSGQGLQVITKDNVPSTPFYDGNPASSGYEANYKKLWGVD